ncbi:MAG TPA: hypothetical protein PLV21_15390 [Cyclobacteriaceae bacterium]|nr:hypothetical protein [Cyclobacteriaceae bacterium]HRJ83271.1 hypothetical protein [Cyclobacteriaceae bacterium]
MKTRALIIILFLVFTTSPLWAQPGDPGGDPDVPITGIEWLLAAGAALGVKRFFNRKGKG